MITANRFRELCNAPISRVCVEPHIDHTTIVCAVKRSGELHIVDLFDPGEGEIYISSKSVPKIIEIASREKPE